MVSRHLFGSWLDGSSTHLREVLGEFEGVSQETLERDLHKYALLHGFAGVAQISAAAQIFGALHKNSPFAA